ncbi:hypothetical protein H4Q26_016278 [Puccinia striiformis f. sp. tritici PST-130]|uniref:Uncharacterized protein n=1 Tax=Puccinia striiformis f. sp. tritici PST-78 TaxID=1165861 RepID=A0A0L0V007_9BASI|nr:hypothetical protein H4Q26_016278 [Puccinia striiformis f. sp. tritici PST-130]KNE92501.1 hypothetical protein PSTG_14102 [Puccinia striiformis f. sp. tritici PST-78]
MALDVKCWANSPKFISIIPSEPHLSGAAYESARHSRMKPYNCPQMVKGTKTPKGSTGKGIISSVATPQSISVPCGLGLQKSGSVEDYESFVDFLKRKKAIDLISDQDAFIRDQLDVEKLKGMQDATHK